MDYPDVKEYQDDDRLATWLADSPREEIVQEAREYVQLASHLLSRLGPDYERLSWILDDSLGFLDEL